MSTELITLYSRTADPAGVARLLRRLHPSVAIEGPDHDWRTATITFGMLWMKRRLTFVYDPDYLAEPNWSAQMDGMRGYLQQLPDSGRKQIAVMLPTTFRYALSARLEPGLAPGADPRHDLITAVARHLDGVLFTPDGLRDAHGRILFGTGGEAHEDPKAAWPRVIAQVPVAPAAAGEDEGDEEDENEIEPPTAQRVARRALALAALTARAVLEQDPHAPDAAERRSALLEWVREMGIEDELEGPSPFRSKPRERSIFESPLGGMDAQAQIDSVWRTEGLAVLAWALGRYDLPPHDAPVNVDGLWEALGLLDTSRARGLLASPVLRPREEIGALCDRLFALHWRLRNYTLRPERMDFAEFARTCWFGPLDITSVPLAEGDLALRGVPIDQAHPGLLGAVNSAAHERHLAANWLYEGPELYSETDAST
jgi:hypothetical protein